MYHSPPSPGIPFFLPVSSMALSSMKIRTGGLIFIPIIPLPETLPEDVCGNVQQIIIDQLLYANALHLCTQVAERARHLPSQTFRSDRHQ